MRLEYDKLSVTVMIVVSELFLHDANQRQIETTLSQV